MKMNTEVRSQKSEVRSRMTDVRPPTSDLRPPTSERGVALIITVILLSLLTLMALAFLTMSQRERGAVTTTTDTASARLAADAALASAEAQIVANVLATTNPYNFGLLVSTNAWPLSFTTTSDLTNLYISPRAPVYLTNLVTQKLENRFYLDLNHNGVDDPNGWLPETNSLGQPTSATNFMVGDPEWIGVLQRPDQPYGPNNPFVARFAFIAVPIGNALDLNAIHNQAFTRTLTNSSDGFLRNQGVGSWEINLAAFLADLNTNQWDGTLGGTYEYLQPAHYNSGAAFADALSLLSYRYGFNYNNLATHSDTTTLMVTATGRYRPRLIRMRISWPTILPCRGLVQTTRIISSPIRNCLTRQKLPLHSRTASGALELSTPPMTDTRFIVCSRSSARIPRRNRTKSTSITQTRLLTSMPMELPQASPSFRARKPISPRGRPFNSSQSPPTGCCAPTPPSGATATRPILPPRSIP
jgi:type II secretory pathway pseudopilin PulG